MSPLTMSFLLRSGCLMPPVLSDCFIKKKLIATDTVSFSPLNNSSGINKTVADHGGSSCFEVLDGLF
jgi:hypothetical protein